MDLLSGKTGKRERIVCVIQGFGEGYFVYSEYISSVSAMEGEDLKTVP